MRIVVILIVGLFLMALSGCPKPATDDGGSSVSTTVNITTPEENPCGGTAEDDHSGHGHAPGEHDNPCNPCGDNPCNPCGDNPCNPCGDNPCNPCGDNPCNPCGDNPCNPCGDNPCNPCGDNPCNPCEPPANPCG